MTVDQPLSENSIARGRVGGGPIVIRYSNTCLKSFRTPSLDSEGMLRGTDNFYFIPLICNGIEYSSTIDTTTHSKDTYGFKSTKNPPPIDELKEFEHDMLKIIQ